METFHYDNCGNIIVDDTTIFLSNLTKKVKTRTIRNGMWKTILKTEDLRIHPNGVLCTSATSVLLIKFSEENKKNFPNAQIYKIYFNNSRFLLGNFHSNIPLWWLL